MAFDTLEAHLRSLDIAPLDAAFEPIAPAAWQPVEAAAGGRFPDVVRWLFERFGGFRFVDGAQYDDPSDPEAQFGWFLSGPELAEAYANTRDSMPDTLVPIISDGGGNFLCVDVATGAIAFWVHDAYLDRNVEPVAASAEAFFQSLRKE